MYKRQHTSVAATVYDKYRKETGDTTKTVIASTASPYKFTRSVMNAIDSKYDSIDVYKRQDYDRKAYYIYERT